MVRDVSSADFETLVIERSREVPVIVDFWAEWCGPCRALGPAIEKAVEDRAGAVELAKVDVDSNQELAAKYRVQGIPAVKAFRDGEIVDEFTGTLPPAQIDAFLDRVVPSEAEEAAKAAIESGDEGALRDAVESDPTNAGAVAALARVLLKKGDPDEAASIAGALAGSDFVVDGLDARAELTREERPPEAAFDLWDSDSREAALEAMLSELEGSDPDRRDLIRRVMVGWFTELGPESDLARTYRRRLSTLIG
jgi:putative thioredoxin